MQQEQDTLGIAFGVIAYLRNFFSEESYETVEYCKKQDGPMANIKKIKLKRLRNTKDTKKIVEWIEELRAHQEVIHKIVIAIYRRSGDSKNNSNCLSCEKISKTNNDIRMNELVEMYSFALHEDLDFKSICKTIQKMDALKGNLSMRLKVFSYDSVELKGFKREHELWMIENEEKMEISGMKVVYKGKGLNKKKVMSYLNSQENGILDAKENTEGSAKDSWSLIDCSCTINTNEKDMLRCTICQGWVHAICFGYFSSKDKRIPRDFRCCKCSESMTVELRNCSIYRRTLWIIYNENTPCEKLPARLKISNSFYKKLVSKLRKDGFIKHNFKTTSYEVLKDSGAKSRIKEYFNGLSMNCSISIDEAENSQ